MDSRNEKAVHQAVEDYKKSYEFEEDSDLRS